MTTALPLVLRVWANHPREKPTMAPKARPITHALFVDTETTTDHSQALLYGCYMFCEVTPSGQLHPLVEGLFYADDLPKRDPAGFAVLQKYSTTHPARVDRTDVRAQRRLSLVSRAEFVEKSIWRSGYKGRATIVMLNANFDWSRLAISAGDARGQRQRKRVDGSTRDRTRNRPSWGGFSFHIFTDERFRPRVQIKSLDSKRSIKRFSKPESIDNDDLLDLDDDSRDGRNTAGRGNPAFRGHLLDVRTLGFALTNTAHSLKSAGETFGIAHPKFTDDPGHGVITPKHVDYGRRDVLATSEIFEKLIAEHELHPINLQPTKAYSPASIAKGYLRTMGIRPALERQPDFDPHALGYSMSAFYGGRAEVHHRGQSLPVVLVDFTSMYPTVVALMELWTLIVAERIDVVDETTDIQTLLDHIAATRDVPKNVWPQLVGIASTQPDGGVIPIRATYGEGNSHTIGVNHGHFTEPVWYALPDLANDAVLTGIAPQIDRGIRFVAVGQQKGLKSVRLRSTTDIDPRTQNPFKTATEQRQRIKQTLTGEHPPGKCRCKPCSEMAFLKTFSLSGSYGIFAEMNRNPLPTRAKETVTVYSNRPEPWTVQVNAIETPGEFCFPPIACCITAAARLMLGLAEHRITQRCGTWVFCDTDSMAIVATTDGGLIPAEGGDHTMPDGQTAVKALSRSEVDNIIDSFISLNPYDLTAVPGSILRVDAIGNCHAISAKRYAIWERDDTNPHQPIRIIKRTEHGLGHLLNPDDPTLLDDDDAPDWVNEVWTGIICDELDIKHDDPDWFNRPALSRYTITSPGLWHAFDHWNQGKDWADQIKPFNFLLVAHVARYNQPLGVDQITLIAPYSNKPEEWATLPWRNRHDPDGPPYTISTGLTDDDNHIIGVQTYADILGNYRRHPEAKFNGPDGQPCTDDTRGQLQRRQIADASIRYIGKEADLIDEVHTGLTPTKLEPTTDYTPDDFDQTVLPALTQFTNKELASRLAGELGGGVSVSTCLRLVQRARRGSRPRERSRAALEKIWRESVQSKSSDL